MKAAKTAMGSVMIGTKAERKALADQTGSENREHPLFGFLTTDANDVVRADESLEEGDWDGSKVWRRILGVVKELQRGRREGEPIH